MMYGMADRNRYIDYSYKLLTTVCFGAPCRYEILTVVNVPNSDHNDVIDSRLTGVINSDARVILLYATPSVFPLFISARVECTLVLILDDLNISYTLYCN